MFKKRYLGANLILILIVALAFAVRVIGIDKYPVGFTQDEASFGYDAYSLLKTGKDQWGERFPLVLRSFGDFKLPLYSYLAIPTVAVFGLNEFAVRLPNAIFGGLAVIATYLMVREFKKEDRKLAILAALLLAFSPWHISLSRCAFEANLTTFFIPFGVWLYLKGLKNKKWMFVASLSFGLNLFSYHTARLVTPVIFLGLYIFFVGLNGNFFRGLKKFVGKNKLGFFTFALFFAISASSIFWGAGQRGSDIIISNPTDKWAAVSDKRYEAILGGMPEGVSRIFSNKINYVLKVFTNNYLSYLSPTFLFSQGAGEATYGMIPGIGVMYFFELFFLISCLLVWAKRKRIRWLEFIFFWILVSPIPAALTKGPGYAANRVVVMIPAIQIISAYGALSLGEYFSRFKRPKFIRLIYYCALMLILTISFTSFLENYIYHSPIHSSSFMQHGTRETIRYVSTIEDEYEEIRISRSVSVPQIWVAFYKKWDPKDYQRYSASWLVYEEKVSYIDQFEGYRLGKYSFGSIDWNLFSQRDDILLVGKPSEFPLDVSIKATVRYPNAQPAYLVVEP